MNNSLEFPQVPNQEKGLEQGMEKLKPVDAMIVLGRGVEKVTINNKEIWKPTRYIQRLNEQGVRTGVREKDLGPNDETSENKVFVAGGEANTLAGIEMIEELQQDGHAPQLIILAAGRPAYLNDEPVEFNEGVVMKEIYEKHIKDLPKMVVLGADKNTKDDVVNSLKTMIEHGLSSGTIINTLIAMPRTQEFYKLALEENPDFAKIQINFLTSENLLERRYKDNPEALERFKKIQMELTESKAWEYTNEREEGGIQAIRDGKYSGRGNY